MTETKGKKEEGINVPLNARLFYMGSEGNKNPEKTLIYSQTDNLYGRTQAIYSLAPQHHTQ